MGQPASHAFHQRVWFVALAVHVITAWFSSGFYTADEHYQVIAFAQSKLGELPIADLPWEYVARIRSALLPGIAYVVIGASRSFVTANPFHIAFLLRLITAVLALIVVRSFVRAMMSQVSDQLQRPFVLLSYFLWFLPYQHVRFAAETWSGLLFLLGLAQLLGKKENRWNMLATGLCFGLSLQLKPVVGIACAGAIAWVLFNDKARRAALLHLLAGLVAALALGSVVDNWFYGAWTPTLWNYMHLAVIGDPAHTFETFPWYYYIPWMMKYGIWPIGVLVVGALVWITYRQPRSWITWCVWPYLIVLSVIPHKELRFLFPLVDLAPLALVLAWELTAGDLLGGPLRRRPIALPIKVIVGSLVFINAIGLLVSATTAAGSGRVRLAEKIAALPLSDRTTLGYALDDDGVWKVRPPSFYLPAHVRDIGAIPISAPGKAKPDLLITLAPDRASSGYLPEAVGYRSIAVSEPGFAIHLLRVYDPDRWGPYVLYAHDPAPSHPSEP